MPEFLYIANYFCKKFSPTTHPLTRVHPLQTDGQTTTMPIARPLLKYGQLKTIPGLKMHIWDDLPQTFANV